MKLLLATDAVGGVWTYSVELARALGRLGVEVVVAAMGPRAGREQLDDARGLTIIETGLPLDWLAETPQDIRRAGAELARFAEQVRADVVQLPGAAFAADAAFRQPVVAVQHSCVASWRQAVRSGPLPDDLAWRRELVERGLRNADAIVAPTAAFAAQTEQIYALGRTLHTVHNGRTPIALPRRTRADFVFTVGRLWDEGKNARTLDEASALVDVPVEAIGPLDGPNGAIAGFANLRTPGALHGRAIAERLAARPIFASPALYEPFGLSALEAAQAGCALILSDIATFRELWDGAAIFVEPTNGEAFARAITALLRNVEARDHLGQAAQFRALNYTPEATARRMLQIYEDVSRPELVRPAALEASAA